MIEVSHNVVKIRNQETDAFEAVPGLVLGYTGEAIEPVIRELSYLKDSDEIKKLIFDMTYPIGSIVHSTREGNPSTYLGYGEWTQIKDVFLLGAGSSHINGEEGGYETITLNEDQIPSHSHTQNVTYGSGTEGLRTDMNEFSQSSIYPQGISTGTTGGGQPHNNMPPYKTVYIWERTA